MHSLHQIWNRPAKQQRSKKTAFAKRFQLIDCKCNASSWLVGGLILISPKCQLGEPIAPFTTSFWPAEWRHLVCFWTTWATMLALQQLMLLAWATTKYRHGPHQMQISSWALTAFHPCILGVNKLFNCDDIPIHHYIYLHQTFFMSGS